MFSIPVVSHVNQSISQDDNAEKPAMFRRYLDWRQNHIKQYFSYQNFKYAVLKSTSVHYRKISIIFLKQFKLCNLCVLWVAKYLRCQLLGSRKAL